MRAFLITLLCVCANVASAAEQKIVTPLKTEPVGVSNYLQMFFGLAVVIGLIVGMAWFMRRMGSLHGMADAQLKVLGGIAVGQRERVVLVQAGETQLLVGVAPGSIRTLHVFEEPIAVNAENKSQVNQSFAEKLHAALKKRGQ